MRGIPEHHTRVMTDTPVMALCTSRRQLHRACAVRLVPTTFVFPTFRFSDVTACLITAGFGVDVS